MKTVLLYILSLVSSPLLFAEEVKLWNDGRITPEQPFKALVVGVYQGWTDDVVILQEIGGNERYCYAVIQRVFIIYHIQSKQEFDKNKPSRATFISPGVEVEEFSWSMGFHRMGLIFGDEDFVGKNYTKPKSEQGGADQPTTAHESKSEGKDKPQPESKVRPR